MMVQDEEAARPARWAPDVAVPGSAGRRSDALESIAARGTGDVTDMVLSLSRRSEDGGDRSYLDWHLFDHLPEQYRLSGMRLGARFVSTPECRDARPVHGELDDVDHAVAYFFAPPVASALEDFLGLGADLRTAGRMPCSLPRVQVGSWTLESMKASDSGAVGACVVPWIPCTGVLLVIERDGSLPPTTPAGEQLAALVDVPGVVGAWTWRGRSSSRSELADTTALSATVAYLDRPPTEVASAGAGVLADRWADGSREPLLAAPLHAVDPFATDRYLPAGP